MKYSDGTDIKLGDIVRITNERTLAYDRVGIVNNFDEEIKRVSVTISIRTGYESLACDGWYLPTDLKAMKR